MNFTEHLQLQGYSSTTIITYDEAATTFLKWCEQENISDATEVSHNDVIAYIKSCADRNISQKTIAHYIGSIKKYYDYLIHEAAITENPCSYIEIKGIQRKIVYDIIPFEALEYLYKTFTTESEKESERLKLQRDKAMLGLLIYQGLQTEELRRLEVQDLRLREGKITIHAGRRSAGRAMKLEAHQVFSLMDYLNDTRKALLQQTNKMPQDTTALFITTAKGTRIESNAVGRLLKQVTIINPAVTSFNQVRASVIVHWLKLYNLRKVQHLAGHKYISSTEAYKSNNLEDLKEDISKYHPF